MQAKKTSSAAVGKIVRLMEDAVGGEEAVVWHEDPFYVLVSTVLSQRTRDENTEKASARLFSAYRSPAELASAAPSRIEALIREAGFYRTKARHIKELSRIIAEEFGGKTPDSIEELLRLPGVGRKTANCVLVYGFGKPAIPVDTHVHRISNRLGWVDSRTPEETEKKLAESVPRRYWVRLNNLMVKFGQRTCLPVKPRCGVCPLKQHCRHYKKSRPTS